MEIKHPPAKIELPRITLKKRNIQDAYESFESVDSDRERLREFLPWVDHTRSVENQIWFFNECIKDWAAGTLFDYSIFSKDKKFIGSIGVHSIQWEKDCCELGYWLHSSTEGKGFISESVRGLENILFDMGFNRIEIRCDPQNKKSSAVALRNGFQFEGILRQETKFRDRYRDTAVFSRIKADLISEAHKK